MTEANVSSKLRVCLVEGGAKAEKVSDRFHACRPDLNICHNGRTIVIETKMYPNTPTMGQAHELTDYVVHGAQVYVATYDKSDKTLVMLDMASGKTMKFTKIKDAAAWVLQQNSLSIKREALR